MKRSIAPRPDGTYSPQAQALRDEVVDLASRGRTPEGIAATLGLSRPQVDRVLRAYLKEHAVLPTPEPLGPEPPSMSLAVYLADPDTPGNPGYLGLLGLTMLDDSHDLDAVLDPET